MKNVFSRKRFNSFLLALVMIFSLFFFAGCDDEESKENNYAKIVYKPYVSSIVPGKDITYAEYIKEGVYDLSKDILTRLVGAYGPDQFTLISDTPIGVYSPSLNGVDYQSLFGYSDLAGIGVNEDNFGKELNAMTKLYFSTENNLVTLSQRDLSSSDIAALVVEIAKLLTPGFISSGIQVVSGSIAGLNALLRVSAGDFYYYVFYGGEIAGLDYISSASDYQNAKTFFATILNTNYNVIEKDFCGLDIVDEASNQLNFIHWNYNLLNGNLENQILDGNEYRTQFLDKYLYKFAAHVAKAMLVGDGEIPSDVVSNGANLSNLYNQAKTGSDTDCQNFVNAAVNYIDHIGLSLPDAKALSSIIKSEVIGDRACASERENLYKNNYDTTIAKCLADTMTANPQQPILEYLVARGTFIENIQINGYLKSIIIMSKQQRESEFYTITFLDDGGFENLSYIVTLRHCSEGSLVEYPVAIEEEDLQSGSIVFSAEDLSSDVNLFEIGKSNDIILLEGVNSILLFDMYKDYVHASETDNTDGVAWCFKDLDNEYIEIVFATNSVFDNFHVDIDCFAG